MRCGKNLFVLMSKTYSTKTIGHSSKNSTPFLAVIQTIQYTFISQKISLPCLHRSQHYSLLPYGKQKLPALLYLYPLTMHR